MNVVNFLDKMNENNNIHKNILKNEINIFIYEMEKMNERNKNIYWKTNSMPNLLYIRDNIENYDKLQIKKIFHFINICLN